MRAVSSFAHLMSSAVSVAARSGTDGYGAPSFGTAVSYGAHLVRKPHLVRAGNGEEVVSSLMAYLNTTAVIEPTARITLSTGDVGSTDTQALQPPLLAVQQRFDERGAHHTVLHLG